MKNLFALLLLVSNLAFASGKLTVAPSYYIGFNKITPTMGIAIYEGLPLGLHYNGWSGIGFQPQHDKESMTWIVSKHDLQIWDGDVGLAVGYTFSHADEIEKLLISKHNVHAEVTFKLW